MSPHMFKKTRTFATLGFGCSRTIVEMTTSLRLRSYRVPLERRICGRPSEQTCLTLVSFAFTLLFVTSVAVVSLWLMEYGK